METTKIKLPPATHYLSAHDVRYLRIYEQDAHKAFTSGKPMLEEVKEALATCMLGLGALLDGKIADANSFNLQLTTLRAMLPDECLYNSLIQVVAIELRTRINRILTIIEGTRA